MKQRIITAILALIIFLPFVIYGDWPFTIFVYFLATIGLFELIKMRKINFYSIPALLTVVMLWTLLLQISGDVIPGIMLSKLEVIMIFAMLLLIFTVLLKNKLTFDDAGFLMLAMIYVGMGFYYLIETRGAGLNYIIFVLFVIWSTDTGAYFVGRSMGKRKLWPEISPNKTIEGALGGVIAACIVGVIFQLVHPFHYSMIIVIAVTVLVSLVGQLGDLVESAFKRHYDVKDSGNILPGHGGILDRLDSLLFVLPLLHFIHFI
ncbi:phosphatidate cytidylyltransferase [Virgibacillus halotolerans]|uniref:phosphatidate cytidylyltransferase n=1 Tax=Virgibacillus halotolerans TaxID=1071053 RepID=UPI001961EDB7|nr:phosphatidate cytidylyltransferase [Virgibacillus halotolerans]MBM7598564.1 phosphatidate cytidylyltransferase [Virgibacillus halotolerans]